MTSSKFVRGILPLVALFCLATPLPAQAIVTVNCGNFQSTFGLGCSLQELLDLQQNEPGAAAITINGTEFSEFAVSDTSIQGSLGSLSEIEVVPVDSRTRPALRFIDRGTAWDRDGRTLGSQLIAFRIRRPAGNLIIGRKLYATFGVILGSDPSDARVSSSVNVNDQMVLYGNPVGGPENDAAVECKASYPVSRGTRCGGTMRRDSQAFVPPQTWTFFDDDVQALVHVNVTAEVINFVHVGHAELNDFTYQLILAGATLHTIVPDMNGDGMPEIAVLDEDRAKQNSIVVEVRDGYFGDLLGTLVFLNKQYKAMAMVALPDLDGDGASELAVLGSDFAHLGTPSEQDVVEVRSIAFGTGPRAINCLSGNQAFEMKLVSGDADHNGIPELAVLSWDINNSLRVEVDNAFGPKNRQLLSYAPNLHALLDLNHPYKFGNLTVVGDYDGNGVPEVAVTVADGPFGSGKYQLDIRNVAGTPNKKSWTLPTGYFPRDMTVLPDADGDGSPELAVLLRRTVDDTFSVQVIRPSDGVKLATHLYGSGFEPLGLEGVPDADGDSVPEVALLMDEMSSARVSVDVRNAIGNANRRSLTFPWGYSDVPRSLAVLDVGGGPEVSVLLNPVAGSHLLVQARMASGAAGKRDISFTN